MDILKFFIVAVTWGASFILMKKASLGFGPMAIAGWRCLAGVLGLLMIVAWRRQRKSPTPWKPGALAVLIVVSYLWPYTLQPVIIAKLNSGFTSILIAFVPIFTVLVSIPMLRTYPTRRQVVGVLSGLVCMIVLFYDKMTMTPAVSHLVLALTVPLSYAIGNTWNKMMFSNNDPLWLAIRCMIAGSLVLLPVSFATEPVTVTESFSLALTSLIVLGVVGTGLAIGIFYTLIQKRGPLFAGMVTYLIPLGGVAFGTLDGEHLSTIQVLALIGVLISVGVAQLGHAGGDEAEAASTGEVEA